MHFLQIGLHAITPTCSGHCERSSRARRLPKLPSVPEAGDDVEGEADAAGAQLKDDEVHQEEIERSAKLERGREGHSRDAER